jgi:hypothetical protein
VKRHEEVSQPRRDALDAYGGSADISGRGQRIAECVLRGLDVAAPPASRE